MSPLASSATLAAARTLLASPRLAAATTTASIGLGVLAPALERTVGLATLVAILTTLLMIVGFSLWVRRGEIEWQGPLPVSLLAFVGWASLSILWSDYQWATLGGIAYLVAFLVLGVGIALTRDTIQIVRSFGDVMRFVLVLSLSVEVLAGAIIDSALPFLGVQGNLPALGPLQGVMGSRNQFALVALLALVTFGIEFATRSVTRGVAIASVSVACSASPSPAPPWLALCSWS